MFARISMNQHHFLVGFITALAVFQHVGANKELFCDEIGLENPYSDGTCDEGLETEPHTGCCTEPNVTFPGKCELLEHGDLVTPKNGVCQVEMADVLVGERMKCCEKLVNHCESSNKRNPTNGDECDRGWKYEEESYCCVKAKQERLDADCPKVNRDYTFPYSDGTCDDGYVLHPHLECCIPPTKCGAGETRDETGKCTTCPPGKYKDSADTDVCRPCYVCEDAPLHRRTVHPCNAASQSQCGECMPGYMEDPEYIGDPHNRYTHNCYRDYSVVHTATDPPPTETQVMRDTSTEKQPVSMNAITSTSDNATTPEAGYDNAIPSSDNFQHSVHIENQKKKGWLPWLPAGVASALLALGVTVALALYICHKRRKKESLQPAGDEDMEAGSQKTTTKEKEIHAKNKRASCLRGSPAESLDRLLDDHDELDSGFSGGTNGDPRSMQGSADDMDDVEQEPSLAQQPAKQGEPPASPTVDLVDNQARFEQAPLVGCSDCKANQSKVKGVGKSGISSVGRHSFTYSADPAQLLGATSVDSDGDLCDLPDQSANEDTNSSSDPSEVDRLTTDGSLPARRGDVCIYQDISSIAGAANNYGEPELATAGGNMYGSNQSQIPNNSSGSSELPPIHQAPIQQALHHTTSDIPRPSGLGQNESTCPKQAVAPIEPNGQQSNSSMVAEPGSMYLSHQDDEDSRSPRGDSTHLGPVPAEDNTGKYQFSGAEAGIQQEVPVEGSSKSGSAPHGNDDFNCMYEEKFMKTGKVARDANGNMEKVSSCLTKKPTSKIDDHDDEIFEETCRKCAGITCDKLSEATKAKIAQRLDYQKPDNRVGTIRKIAELCTLQPDAIAGDSRGVDLLNLLAKQCTSLQAFLAACNHKDIGHVDIVQIIRRIC